MKFFGFNETESVLTVVRNAIAASSVFETSGAALIIVHSRRRHLTVVRQKRISYNDTDGDNAGMYNKEDDGVDDVKSNKHDDVEVQEG